MYKYSTKIRDKEVKFRKWKVKDKNKFIEQMKGDDNRTEIQNALVYDCLEDKKIILSDEEYKHLVISIRSVSLGEEIKFNFTCDKCNEDYVFETKILDVVQPEFENFGKIESNGISFEMGDILNRIEYDKAMLAASDENERFFLDFLFHIKKMNGSDAITMDSIIEKINELDVDIYEDLFKQWKKMSFTNNDVHEVMCPHCGEKQKYKFDNLPGFFPENWI